MMPRSETPAELAERLGRWLDYPVSTGASVSADGVWAYHLSDRGGLPQAWRVPLGGGPSSLVVPGDQRVGRVEAAPMGSAVLLSIDQGGDEHWQLHVLDGSYRDGQPAVRPLTADPEVFHEPGGWRDEFRYVFTSNRRDRRFFDVQELDTRLSSPPRLLHAEDALVTVGAVRDRRVLAERMNTNLDADLLLIEEERTTVVTPHTGEVSCFGDLTKDAVLAAANPDREFLSLVRYRAPGAAEVLAEFPGDIDHLRVDRGGTRAALTVNRDGWSELHLVDLNTNEIRKLALPEAGTVGGEAGTVGGLAWTPDGTGLLVELSSPTGGAEVHLYDVRTGGTHPVTRSPVPLPGPPATPALFRFAASDGLAVPYWEFVPDARTPRGTLIWVHGGPESQARPGFAPINSFLVGEGWRVVQPNVRGSTGYGRTYVHLDDVRRRMDSVRDLSDLVGALVARGAAETGKIGILGGSYGGFMVLSAITTYPDLWGAAVDFVGIANFVTFLERTGVWRRKVREDEYGSLERDRDFLEAISPIHHTDQIRSPLLVVHGANDPRVPVGEAEQIVAELQRRRVAVEYLRYENEGHGLVRRENRREAYARAAHFFALHLDPNGRPPRSG